jgi:hypothetical protein
MTEESGGNRGQMARIPIQVPLFALALALLLTAVGCAVSGEPWRIQRLLTSPDGELIAVSAKNDLGRLFCVYGILERDMVFHANQGPLIQPESWHANSRELLVTVLLSAGSLDDGVYRVELPSGEEMARVVPRLGVETDPVWSPDYSEIAFTGAVADPRGHIVRHGAFVCEVTDQETELLAEDLRPFGTVAAVDGGYGVLCRDGVDVEEINSSDSTVARIWLVDRNGGSLREIVSPQMNVSLTCSVSPDGSEMALLRSHTEDVVMTEVMLYGWREDVTRTVAVQDRLLRTIWSPTGHGVLCVGENALHYVTADELEVTEVRLDDWRAQSAGRAVDWAGGGNDIIIGLDDEVVRLNLLTGKRTSLFTLR